MATDIESLNGYSNTLIAFDKQGQALVYKGDSMHD